MKEGYSPGWDWGFVGRAFFLTFFFGGGRLLGVPSREKDRNGSLAATKRRFEKCSYKLGPYYIVISIFVNPI